MKPVPQKTVRHTVNVPGEIEEVIKQRIKDLGYRSVSNYWLSLALFDLYARRPHILTAALFNERQEVKDQFYAELARCFDDHDCKPGSWFEKRINEIVAERSGQPTLPFDQ